MYPSRAVGERYGVGPHTIKRWVKAGIFPPPDTTIRNRHYWDEGTLERHERRRVAAQEVAPPPRSRTPSAEPDAAA
jgi:DNA-binding transcriptional MerR regulator